MAPDEANEQGLCVSVVTNLAQPLPSRRAGRCVGMTVMFVDERTIRHAGQTGLILDAANGTRFIGSRSAGANGDEMTIVVPGNITIWRSRVSVRHADGRRPQRVGLAPGIEVAPTIKGIQEGRDDMLERAVEYAQTALSMANETPAHA